MNGIHYLHYNTSTQHLSESPIIRDKEEKADYKIN